MTPLTLLQDPATKSFSFVIVQIQSFLVFCLRTETKHCSRSTVNSQRLKSVMELKTGEAEHYQQLCDDHHTYLDKRLPAEDHHTFLDKRLPAEDHHTYQTEDHHTLLRQTTPSRGPPHLLRQTTSNRGPPHLLRQTTPSRGPPHLLDKRLPQRTTTPT